MSETHQGTVGLGTSVLAISTIATALRFCARFKQKAALKTDDWLMIPCLVSLDNIFSFFSPARSFIPSFPRETLNCDPDLEMW
jgi:hypothetical protein